MCLTVRRCFCLNLRAAGMALGVMFFIANWFMVTYSVKELLVLNEQEKEDFEMFSERDSEKIAVITSQIFSYLLSSFASLLIIIGIKKKLHLLLLPWMVLHALVVLLWIGACFYLFFLAGVSWTSDLGRSLIFVIVSITGPTIAIYLWIVIFSLFSMIQKENENPVRESLLEGEYI